MYDILKLNPVDYKCNCLFKIKNSQNIKENKNLLYKNMVSFIL